MHRLLLTLLTAAAFAVVSSAYAACTSYDSRSARADAAGIRTVRIVSGPGSLNVRGDAAAERVTVEGEACASDRSLLEEVRLELERDGDLLIVRTVTPPAGFLETVRLDLDVRLPEAVDVEIDDGSGDVDVADVGSLGLRDGSGDVLVRGVRGAFRVRADGSGEVTASDVGGNVTVEEDGSGNILLRRIAGDVLVLDDGSGDITVEEVQGDFTVEDAGSGAVRHEGVGGTVSVPRD